MEVLLLIVALIVGIFVIAGSGNSRGERSSPPTTSKERRTPPAQYGTSSPSRFDEKSAKHLRGERILTGAV